MKTLIIILVAFLSSLFNTLAQKTIEAKVENWQYGEAGIGSLDFISGEIQEFGRIDKQGNLKIELQDNFLQRMKEQMEKEQEKAPEGWKASLKTVQGTFSCMAGDLSITNAETNLSSLPKQLYVFKSENEILGLLMPTSNQAIANYFQSYGQENTQKGKYLEWTYLDEPASVNGSCSTNTFTQDSQSFEDVRKYALELKKGWNLIEYEITEVFEESSGKIHPKTTVIQHIENIPAEINWYFSPEK